MYPSFVWARAFTSTESRPLSSVYRMPAYSASKSEACAFTEKQGIKRIRTSPPIIPFFLKALTIFSTQGLNSTTIKKLKALSGTSTKACPKKDVMIGTWTSLEIMSIRASPQILPVLPSYILRFIGVEIIAATRPVITAAEKIFN